MYVPLHVRSTYSLCRGTASIGALVDRAAHFGHDTLALTDRNNLYGLVPFIRACDAAGIQPIPGVELDGPEGQVVLLARDEVGFAGLCRLVTRRMFQPDASLVAGLSELHQGLHVLTCDPVLLEQLVPHIPRDSLWAELPAPLHARPAFARIAEAAERFRVRPVATGAVALLDRTDHALHTTLTAIRTNGLAASLSPHQLAHPEAFFKPPAAMRSLFRRHATALRNTRLLADSCGFVPRRDRWIFPDPPLPDGLTAAAHLRQLCDAGLVRRYGKRPVVAVRRLEKELAVIDRLGFSTYFVVVGEICRFAHRRGIATVGRGSGASALTAYLLGITNVDPIRYGLTFERFLHEKRPDCPDLDIDLCWIKRDEVIEHVYETYGRDRVAMISTHNTFQARSAFREAAKAHGISNARVNRLSRCIPHYVEGSLRRTLDVSARGHEIPRTETPWPRILDEAERLLGLPRHLGLHPGGIVISDRPLDHYVPLEEATKGIVCTQFEMRAVEAVGLVKIDLLGNRALSTIQETLEIVAERHWTRPDPDSFPHEDRATADLFAAGDTLGVFQMESPGMRSLNRMLGTRDLTTTIAAVALIRPGPAGRGMKGLYCRRARGLEPVVHVDPRLEPVLRETYGLLLYEEDVMRVASEVAGIGLEDGDVLRRAIAGGTARDREELGGTFVARARERGYAHDTASRIWERLLSFGAFAFCKAHAAGYGVLAWQAGWLKAHHPLEFATAILNHHAGMYSKRTHLEDAKRHGVVVQRPHVNRSRDTCVCEGRTLRLGLSWIRGLSESTREALLAERARRPFAGLEEFLVRVPRAARPEAEALILGGAFDDMGHSRPELLCILASGYDTFHRRARERGPAARDDLFVADAPVAASWGTPSLAEFSEAERTWQEWHVLGLCVDRHPMAFFRESAAFPRGVLTTAAAERCSGRRVRVAGLAAARRITATKKGDAMQFVTLEDEAGLLECTLFPGIYAAHRGLIRDLGPYLVVGRIEEQYGAPTLTVERMERVPVPADLGTVQATSRGSSPTFIASTCSSTSTSGR